MIELSRLFVLLITSSMMLGCLEPPYHYVECWLPILRSDEPMQTLVYVGDEVDRKRISQTCPAPVARTFEADRPYGTIKFEWWGSPHKLYISATADDGQPLEIQGGGIEPYNDTSGSWLEEYSYERRFPGNFLPERPEPVDFTIEIDGADGQRLDVIDATYDTVLCECAVPEYIEGAPTQ